jgi:hypothetical protein
MAIKGLKAIASVATLVVSCAVGSAMASDGTSNGAGASPAGTNSTPVASASNQTALDLYDKTMIAVKDTADAGSAVVSFAKALIPSGKAPVVKDAEGGLGVAAVGTVGTAGEAAATAGGAAAGTATATGAAAGATTLTTAGVIAADTAEAVEIGADVCEVAAALSPVGL